MKRRALPVVLAAAVVVVAASLWSIPSANAASVGSAITYSNYHDNRSWVWGNGGCTYSSKANVQVAVTIQLKTSSGWITFTSRTVSKTVLNNPAWKPVSLNSKAQGTYNHGEKWRAMTKCWVNATPLRADYDKTPLTIP